MDWPAEKIIIELVLPGISVFLWFCLFLEYRKQKKRLWGKNAIILKATMTGASNGRDKMYTYVVNGEQREWKTSYSSYSQLSAGDSFYVYYNPKTQKVYPGEKAVPKKSNYFFTGIMWSIFLVPVVYFNYANYVMKFPALKYYVAKAGFALVGLIILAVLFYNVPRWRKYRKYARDSWSVLVSAEVIGKERVSGKKDRLRYRVEHEDFAFTDEVKVLRHPVWYNVGDTMPVYYNSKIKKSCPLFLTSKLSSGSVFSVLAFIALLIYLWQFMSQFL